MRMTKKQRDVFEFVRDRGHPTSARRIADGMEKPGFRRAMYSYDEVYAQLRLLEDKGAMRRVGKNPIKWQHIVGVEPEAA